MINSILAKIKNLILKVVLKSNQEDGNFVYKSIVSAYGQQTYSEIYYPYGYYAVAPSGAVGIKINLSNQPENQITLPYEPNTRFTGNQVGEVQIGNQLQNIYIKFNNEGQIEIISNTGVNINGNVIIEGNLTVTGEINSGSSIT